LIEQISERVNKRIDTYAADQLVQSKVKTLEAYSKTSHFNWPRGRLALA